MQMFEKTQTCVCTVSAQSGDNRNKSHKRTARETESHSASSNGNELSHSCFDEKGFVISAESPPVHIASLTGVSKVEYVTEELSKTKEKSKICARKTCSLVLSTLCKEQYIANILSGKSDKAPVLHACPANWISPGAAAC
ncbi:hypothetical protein PAMP_015465 [Pampus punctatissimus]